MTRTPLWQAIARALQADIAEGRYGPGDKLPTEQDLSARFGVNRHTVRRALKALVDDKVIFTRRGAGAFVLSKLTDYPLGRRVRFHQNLLAAGRRPDRKVLGVEVRGATQEEAARLQIDPGEEICESTGISFADSQPVMLFRTQFPECRYPGLHEHLAVGGVTDALRAVGVSDYTRVSTRVQARAADATQALHLQVSEGAPLLYTTSLNVDPEGVPVEFGMTWFVGDRITLTLEGGA